MVTCTINGPISTSRVTVQIFGALMMLLPIGVVAVTAQNSAGSATAISAPTDVVKRKKGR